MISRKSRYLEIFLFTCALAAILWAGCFSFITIRIPHQIELREGTALVMTKIFLQWGNPFVLENQPLAMNNYGVVYNLFVLPFAALFGNTLAVHRSITFLFIVLSAMVGFVAVHKKTGSRSLSLTCAAFIMIALIGQAGIGAFPSSLGTLLFLLAMIVPFLRSFDRQSLIFSALISVIAFYTKPYFILAFGIVASYLFMFVSKRKSLLYVLVFLMIFISSVLLAVFLFPLYIINTVIGNASNTHRTLEHLVLQLQRLLQFFWPVLLLLAFTVWRSISERDTQKIQINLWALDVFAWDQPLFRYPFGFLFYSFVCSMSAFLLILGPHIGNYLNYAFQLLIPTFFCWFLGEFNHLQKWKTLTFFVLAFNLLIWEWTVLPARSLNQRESSEWTQVHEYLKESSITLNAPATAAEVIALGQMPVDSGQTAYFYEVRPFSENWFTATTYDQFHEDGFRYTLSIDRMIEKQKFDLVVTTREKANFYHDRLLQDFYFIVDEIQVDMPQSGQSWTLVFWKPLAK